MKKSDWKKFWKKFWFIVWKDDSFKGWIISVIFLFVIIKLIFFPLLELTTGTALPLVIVESCSMHHKGTIIANFDNWWQKNENKYENFEINKNTFDSFSLKNGFTKGDILFITGVKPKNVKIGDIIIFEANYRNPIIHRVVEIKKEDEKYVFSTIGDNNNGQLPIEKSISENQLIGKASLNLAPYMGWVKLIFFEHQKSNSQKGFCN